MGNLSQGNRDIAVNIIRKSIPYQLNHGGNKLFHAYDSIFDKSMPVAA